MIVTETAGLSCDVASSIVISWFMEYYLCREMVAALSALTMRKDVVSSHLPEIVYSLRNKK